MNDQLQLEDAAFDRAVSEVARTHDDLVRARDSLTSRVQGLLGSGWSGQAADEYAEAWADWEDGAGRVLDGLAHLGAVMAQVKASLLAQDDDELARMSRVRARLGGAS